MTANVLRAGDRNPVLRLRQGYGTRTLLAVRSLCFKFSLISIYQFSLIF